MTTEMGEYIVGSYLKMILGCDHVDYNVRPSGGGLKSLGELDVIGLNFETDTAYICEVTTHIRGLLYVSNQETVARIKRKHERQKEYAREQLHRFSNHKFMFWSPVVPVGHITSTLAEVNSLELVINKSYADCVDQLTKLSAEITHDTGNPFFRTLQILSHMRR
jgi:hypothetical protein